MGKKNGLSVLHVCSTGHQGMVSLHRLIQQGLCQLKQETGYLSAMPAQPHTNQGSNLIIAGPSRPQLASHSGPNDGKQTALQSRCFIFIILPGTKFPLINLMLQSIQGLFHLLQLIGSQQSCPVQSLGMSTGACNIIVSQTPVKLSRLTHSCQGS